MDLEPEQIEELQTKEYWDKRYNKEAKFDWFMEFDKIRDVLEKIPKDHRILMLGCGNSTLSKDMYNNGWTNIVNIDFSPNVIDQMRKQYPEMEWLEMDVRAMTFPESTFDSAIDKGTLDALLSYKGSVWQLPASVQHNVDQYMDEIHRVLRPGGTFLYISYRQPHFAKLAIDRPYWSTDQSTIKGPPGSLDYYSYLTHNN
ncbi:hypothetical protein CANCADRAFT_3242 [Tortispora caseinolytica NRRL Y-17796]|uniref:Methyltransferase type 11 domain-containing protein n=1 Tax=Tortispora caseinolytica NRRL Y-17796 TaxID=767744 RepID=A0A1E4T9Z2_9ASCO|nr:hypothetical protein CANCADRAFT_3242 [Tortispora caseinolytica NRRL Y-17796]